MLLNTSGAGVWEAKWIWSTLILVVDKVLATWRLKVLLLSRAKREVSLFRVVQVSVSEVVSLFTWGENALVDVSGVASPNLSYVLFR